MTRYASANNEKTGHINFGIAGKKLSFASASSCSDFEDLETGSHFDSDYPTFGKRPIYADRVNGVDEIVTNGNESLQKFSGYRQWSTINKVPFRSNDNMELGYGLYLTNTSDIPRYDRLTTPDGNSLRQSGWYYGPQKWNMHHLQMNLYSPAFLYDEARVIATCQLFEESRHDRRFGSNQLRNQKEKVNLYTLNIDMNKKFRNNSLYYGVEYTYNKVDSQADILDMVTNSITLTSARYPNGGSKYSSMVGYATY